MNDCVLLCIHLSITIPLWAYVLVKIKTTFKKEKVKCFTA